ncbi:metallophosphoesterase [uncultured Paludibaculum sp.]|uniref:metallophosphoesterase family protein n=1 Tax=uncultured Paludibaculum sp. TaxID=1765020 RepID=UPI002AAC1982|nr:metallophosphoesterase [uncultured Paludibaculum sp.]
MKLLVFSDIHNDLAMLRRLMETDADYYVAAGDMVNWARGLDAIGPILQPKAPRVYVLPGNHEHADQIEAFCLKFGLNPLHGRHFQAGRRVVAGLGHSSPTPFDTPGEYSESEMAERLAPLADPHPEILICHCPPLGTPLDEAAPGRHFGSQAVGDFLAKVQPVWFFCGHIHEAAGRETALGSTRARNVGKQGYLLELPD